MTRIVGRVPYSSCYLSYDSEDIHIKSKYLVAHSLATQFAVIVYIVNMALQSVIQLLGVTTSTNLAAITFSIVRPASFSYWRDK